MKQFQLLRANGDVRGPFTEDFALHFHTGYDDRQTLKGLEVGFSMRDADGDLWTRLEDVSEGETTPTQAHAPLPTVAQRAERLERIATAALQGLITGVLSAPELAAAHASGAKQKGFTFEQYLAIDAVAMAKALIAELDKQAWTADSIA